MKKDMLRGKVYAPMWIGLAIGVSGNPPYVLAPLTPHQDIHISVGLPRLKASHEEFEE